MIGRSRTCRRTSWHRELRKGRDYDLGDGLNETAAAWPRANVDLVQLLSENRHASDTPLSRAGLLSFCRQIRRLGDVPELTAEMKRPEHAH